MSPMSFNIALSFIVCLSTHSLADHGLCLSNIYLKFLVFQCPISEICRYLYRLLVYTNAIILGGVVVIDAAFGAHGKSRPRFKPGTLLHRCSDLGQVVNLSLSLSYTTSCPPAH